MKLLGFICLIFLAGLTSGWAGHHFLSKKSPAATERRVVKPSITTQIEADLEYDAADMPKKKITPQIYVAQGAQFEAQASSVPLNLPNEAGGQELDEMTHARHRLGRIELDKKTMVYLDFIEDKIHFPSTYELRESFTQKLLISFDVYNQESATFYFPGNGSFYLKQGHLGLCGSQFSRKFNWQKDRFIEQKQAFYYIGKKTKVVTPTPLFESEDSQKVVANLMPDSEVTVIGVSSKTALNEPGKLLVKSQLGLIGWHRSYAEKSGELEIYQCN